MNTVIILKFKWLPYILGVEFLVWIRTHMTGIRTVWKCYTQTTQKAFLAHTITFTLNQRCRMK
ncbi:hypothetical protein A9P97_14240 [Klebsiella pneumoniae]|nr:hypothetical protein A593_00230 [Klebsiella variicola]OCV82005.1 hypothetical protein A9P97_14240 [Klebsiella pneumoniae]